MRRPPIVAISGAARARFLYAGRVAPDQLPNAIAPASVRAAGPAGLRVTRSVVLPENELRWQFSASGGPGGQHANTSNTRAEVIFDIEASAAFGPVQRERLLAKLGPSIRVVASDTRSQARNRQLAQARLVDQLVEALHIDKPRRPTRPSKAATARRLDAKAHQSKRKDERRRPRPGVD